jgi:hypothetical protein
MQKHFSKFQRGQKGISTLVGVIIIVVAALVLFGGVFVYQYFAKISNSQFIISNKNSNVQNSNTETAQIKIISPNRGDVWRAVNDINTIKWTYNGIEEGASVSIEIVNQTGKTVCDVSEGFVSLKDKQLTLSHDYLSVPGCIGSNRKIKMVFHGNKTTTPDYEVVGYSDYFNIVNP